MSSALDQSPFLRIIEITSIANIEIEFGLSFSLIYILSSLAAAFGEVKIDFFI
jgi:hypothetical protein